MSFLFFLRNLEDQFVLLFLKLELDRRKYGIRAVAYCNIITISRFLVCLDLTAVLNCAKNNNKSLKYSLFKAFYCYWKANLILIGKSLLS